MARALRAGSVSADLCSGKGKGEAGAPPGVRASWAPVPVAAFLECQPLSLPLCKLSGPEGHRKPSSPNLRGYLRDLFGRSLALWFGFCRCNCLPFLFAEQSVGGRKTVQCSSPFQLRSVCNLRGFLWMEYSRFAVRRYLFSEFLGAWL